MTKDQGSFPTCDAIDLHPACLVGFVRRNPAGGRRAEGQGRVVGVDVVSLQSTSSAGSQSPPSSLTMWSRHCRHFHRATVSVHRFIEADGDGVLRGADRGHEKGAITTATLRLLPTSLLAHAQTKSMNT